MSKILEYQTPLISKKNKESFIELSCNGCLKFDLIELKSGEFWPKEIQDNQKLITIA
jgi:hypothetical protein